MWSILQRKTPDDFVISTDKSYSVRFFVEEAYKNIGVKIKWIGKGKKEKGIDIKTNKTIISINKKYFRPNEVDYLKGDSFKAKKELNWKPKISFKRLVKEMVSHEIDT
jgi:GDPmannose 4,6-dehydratase